MRSIVRVNVLSSFCSLVDGKLVSGKEMAVINPATGEAFASCYVPDQETVNLAIKAAAQAFELWRTVPLADRRALLVRLADIIRDNTEQLTELLTLEQGKPLRNARNEILGSEATFRHYASYRAEQTNALFDFSEDTYIRTFTPLGVVAGIIPWNYPFAIVAGKIAPALLTGNTIIIKPSPTTPLTTLEFARLCAKEVPTGLLQVLADDGSVGPILTSHPDVSKIAFTGSTVTGRKIMEAGAKTLKRLTLELGGNDPAIVLDDADPAAAAAGIFTSAFMNCGQVCAAIKRVYVHEDSYADFCKAFAKLIDGITVGDGMQPGVTMGPLQNKMQYDKASAFLAEATRSGRVLAQGDSPSGKGYFLPPTVITDLNDDHPLVREEQFAPIVPILKYRTEAEAIARANDTPYGLQASVWSSNRPRAQTVAVQLDAMLVSINKHNAGGPPGVGYALTKQSGIGWLEGDEGVKEYLQQHIIAL